MWLPAPNRDAASLQMVRLLEILRELCESVTFAADDYAARASGHAGLRALGVQVLAPPAFESVAAHLRDAGAQYDVIWLSRVPIASKYLELARQYAPRARIIFDTTDLHYLRGFRGAKVTRNLNLLRRALEMKQVELATARRADVTLVVSPVEKEILSHDCPEARVQLVPLIETVKGSARPFAQRSGIVFVGAFPHHPNADAMRFFCDDILPLAREQLGNVKITIIGSQPPEWLAQYSNENFVVTGHVPDLAPYLNECRLTIAPLRYGAGMKSKVLTSMSYGVPVDSTSVAAEGMPVVNRCELLIADGARDFANAMGELYRDEMLWRTLSENGMKMIAEHFSPNGARDALVKLFQDL